MNIFLAMAPQGGDSGSLVSTLLMMGSIFLIFYFMIIRPQQKRQKERDKMIESVEKGDTVVTSSGMYGTVTGLEDKIIYVEIAQGVKVKFDKSAITVVNKKK